MARLEAPQPGAPNARQVARCLVWSPLVIMSLIGSYLKPSLWMPHLTRTSAGYM